MKRFGEQASADADEPVLVGDAGSEAPEAVVDDPGVVERELGEGVDGVPAGLAVGGSVLGERLGGDERHVGDRGEPAAGVPLRLGVGAELLEVHGADAGLLAQLALGGLLGRLVVADEAAR